MSIKLPKNPKSLLSLPVSPFLLTLADKRAPITKGNRSRRLIVLYTHRHPTGDLNNILVDRNCEQSPQAAVGIHGIEAGNEMLRMDFY